MSDQIKIIYNELDGRKIVYTSETEFLVQVGRGSKGGYTTKYRIKGNLEQAVMYFNGINIGMGYKKRLTAPSLDKPLLSRAKSSQF